MPSINSGRRRRRLRSGPLGGQPTSASPVRLRGRRGHPAQFPWPLASWLGRYAPGAAAFTLIELLVVIAVMGILAAMLLPALAHSKERARRAECLGHLRQLGAAVYLYVDEHGYRLPAAERRPTTPVFTNHILPRICDLLSNYVAGNRAVFACPKDQAGYHLKEGSSYEWNYTLNGQRLEQLMRPDGILPIHEAPMMYDYENVHETSKGPAKNVLFADGRVDQL